MADEDNNEELTRDIEEYLKKQKDQVPPEEKLKGDVVAPTGDKVDDWLRSDQKSGEQGTSVSNPSYEITLA